MLQIFEEQFQAGDQSMSSVSEASIILVLEYKTLEMHLRSMKEWASVCV